MASTSLDQRWDVPRVARAVSAGLTLMTASYFLVVAFDNITNPDSNWVFVQGVISGDGVIPDSGFEWRFIDATWFQVVSYVGIIVAETLAGLALAVAGFISLRRSADSDAFARAQRLTWLGCTFGLLVFFFGFITVGGNWFVMYLNETWNGLEPAFQNSVMTVLTLLVSLVVVGVDRVVATIEGGRLLDVTSVEH
jgi:predicted small integral membrane protein